MMDVGGSNESRSIGIGLPPPRGEDRSRPTSGLASSRPGGHAARSSALPASQANDFDEEALDEIRRYESFSTVDWIADSTRERSRAAREARKSQLRHASSLPSASSSSNTHLANGSASRLDPAWGKPRFGSQDRPPRWWPISNPWGRRAWWVWRFICGAAGAVTDSGVVVLVGLLIGINMALISIATEWASDIKQGYCSAGWWLNRKFCCGEIIDTPGPGGAALPPAAIKAAQAAATTTTALPIAATNALSNANASLNLLPSRASAIANAALLLSRADPMNGPSTSTGVSADDVCVDWVPWSTWTFPSWIIYILFAAAFSSMCAHLVRVFSPYAAGSGISEIKCILAGFIINGYLGAWTLAIKSLGLPLAIASGLSVGKEGPAVHIACCIGNVVAHAFRSFDRSQARMRELLTAASAAGVAVAFGSPIGGVLFSLEEMAYNFPSTTMWRSFLCALAATVALSFMNPFQTGKLVLFQVSYDRDWHYFEIIFYVIIGIFGGLYGALVIKYNLQVQKFRRENLAAHGVSEACILAVLTAFIGYWNMFLRIDMTESLEILFRECEGGGDYDNLCQSWAQWRMVNSLLLATVLRIALVILSYGCKVPAGIFVPSMAIGATFGRMIGILVKALYNAFPNSSFFSACQPEVPCITPGTYAFLGAAAALAGVTRITVAVVVIMFELTGALTYILPTMLVVMITKGVGDWYGKGGIAEQTIKFQGYPFLDKDDHVFNLPVSDVMTKEAAVLYASGMQLRDVEARLAQGPYKGFPVVRSKDDRNLLGYAGKTELRYAIGKARRVRTGLGPETECRFSIDPDAQLISGEGAHMAQRQQMPTPMLGSYEDDSGAAHNDQRRDGAAEEGVNLMPSRDGQEEEGEEEEEDTNDTLLGAAGGGIDGEGDFDVLELGGWVEQNPLHVQPTMPLEVVMDLFKKMGPRVILVSLFGELKGLVTVKDLLKLVAAQERAHAVATEAARDARLASGLPLSGNARRGPPSSATARGGTATGIRSASTAFAQTIGSPFGEVGSVADFGGELEILLRDAWEWGKRRISPILGGVGGGGLSRDGSRTVTSSSNGAWGRSTGSAGDEQGRYESLRGRDSLAESESRRKQNNHEQEEEEEMTPFVVDDEDNDLDDHTPTAASSRTQLP